MEPARSVVTVTGEITPQQLGLTLMHEHVLVDMPHVAAMSPPEAGERGRFEAEISMASLGGLRYGRVVNRSNCSLSDIDTAIEEIALFSRAGGRTVVDATSIGIGRDPAGLAEVARATGVNMVMGSGWYVEPTWPAGYRIAERTEADLRDEILCDLAEGVGGSGIRAGFIGEIGCSWPLTPAERKVLRAAAAAQLQSGAALMVHPGRACDAPTEIVSILADAGADLSRTILCHIDRTIADRGRLKQLAATGCVLEYDLFGMENSYYPYDLPVDMPNDAGRIDWIRWLIAEGHRDQITISHDICFRHLLVRYGGAGYRHIPANVVPLMRRKGMTEAAIRRILVETPARLLARPLASPAPAGGRA